MITLRLYNTLTRHVEEFRPLHPPTVTYYSCGPTVYDYAHIGHARTYVFADVLERVLRLNGYNVKRVMNITDVGHLTSNEDTGEDKMEKGALRENKSVWDIAKFYTDDFFLMLEKLNIPKPGIICKATQYIQEMIIIVKTLTEKGFTYTIADGVYFDTSKFPHYGVLTGQNFATLEKTLKAGARVEVVEGKKHPTDFALWKFSYPAGRSFDSAQAFGSEAQARRDDAEKRRQMEWDSPWGLGFPGWHIECSAMSMKFLGPTLDIHSGGVDHIPVHHTNEIAQSEAATGKPFVRFWLHGEFLLIEGEKMSKSLQNFYRVKDIEDRGFSPLALRYLFLTSSYRKQMNFTWKALKGAQLALEGLYDEMSTVVGHLPSEQQGQSYGKKLESFKKRFMEAINDDLNTAKALAITWEVVKSNISYIDKRDLLCLFDEVLGLRIRDRSNTKGQALIPEDIEMLRIKRDELRKEKKWDDADSVRQEIEKKDYLVEDTAAGTAVFPKKKTY